VEALCTTLLMMAARRVVIIRDVEQWKRRTRGRSAVVRYLEHPSPETVLILVQGASEEKPDKDLLKHAEPIACAMDSGADVRRWLDRRASERGLTFEDGAVDHLLKVAGTSLSAISIELEKLASLPPGVAVTVKQVEDLVGVRHGETPLDWRAAILDDDPARALELLPNVLSQSGVSGVRLISLLGTTLIGVGIVRVAHEKGQRGKALSDAAFAALSSGRPGGLGAWGPEASLWARWSARWPASRIRAALDAALLADRSIKNTGLSSEQAILSDMIMRIAHTAPVPAGAR
jgi:DNA polymerase-3 subunit delta